MLSGSALVTDGAPFPTSPSTLALDSYINSFRVDRGRPDEFSSQQAGQAQIVLNNSSGDFDATNTSGAFYGHLLGLTQTKIAMANPWTGTPYDIFTGYVESWDYERQGPRSASTTAALVDMMALLASADVNTSARLAPWGAFYAAQHWDDRIKAALLDAGVPAAYFRVSTGNINCQANNYSAGQKCLEVILDAVDAEFPGVSNCWVDPSGIFRASGRLIRGVDGSDPDTNPDYSDFCKRWRVGDAAAIFADPSLLPIYDIQWERTKASIINRCLVTPEGATEGAITANYVASPASVNAYGIWEKAMTGLLMLDADDGNTALQETKAIGEYLVGNYADPHDRITSIEFHGQMDDGTTAPGGARGNLWDFILGVDINHIIEVTTFNPPGGLIYPTTGNTLDPTAAGATVLRKGGFNSTEFFVEGIHHDVSRLNETIPRWSLKLDLSLRPKIKKIVSGVVSDF